MKKFIKIVAVLMFLYLITGCGEKESLKYYDGMPNVGSTQDGGVQNVGGIQDPNADYFLEFDSTKWEEEKINETLQYRKTEILPSAEGENYSYKIGTRVVDIIIDGDINVYINKLKSLGYRGSFHRYPENNFGLRNYYGYFSPEDTLLLHIYPMDDGKYEVNASAKLPGGIYSEFKRYFFDERFNKFSKYYPNEEPVSQLIVEPEGKYFTVYQSEKDYFRVSSTIEFGDPDQFKNDLVKNGYVKVEENLYRIGNFACHLYDFEENKYSIEYYIIEVPQYDFEHLTLNYNNNGYYLTILNGRRIILYFNKGNLYLNPPKELGEPVDHYRTPVSYNREGCNRPTELHVFGTDQARGYIEYDFIIEYNFYNYRIELVEDHSFYK